MFKRISIAAGALALAGVSLAGVASLASASPTAGQGAVAGKPAPVWPEYLPKSQQPMNINPEKTPDLTPPKGGERRAAAARPSEAQKLADAQAFAAKHPNEAVVCFKDDGTVAGVAVADRVNKDQPISEAEKASICTVGKAGKPGGKGAGR
ncbi:hypothetical protein ACFCV9_32390 [Streptomyces sp. NPDC056367]|uniref:hypothetical protein n=1 Tax=unclassified Streptomyces TaxID=2593676 RepID=UPI0035DEA80F